MQQSDFTALYLSTHLSTYLSTYRSICLPTYLSFSLSSELMQKSASGVAATASQLQQLSVSWRFFADAVWCICTCPEATKLWKNVFFWKALVVFHSHVWTAVRIRNQRHPLDEIWTYVKSNHVICIRFSSVLELMAITEDQDRTCWPVDIVCYKYNSLLQVRKQENHIIPIIPCHPHPTPPHA